MKDNYDPRLWHQVVQTVRNGFYETENPLTMETLAFMVKFISDYVGLTEIEVYGMFMADCWPKPGVWEDGPRTS